MPATEHTSFNDLYEMRQQLLALPIPESAKQQIETIFDLWLHTSDDLNWHQAIMDGSWPNAVTILEDALEKARNKKAEEKI